jgi:hypothetical protein
MSMEIILELKRLAWLVFSASCRNGTSVLTDPEHRLQSIWILELGNHGELPLQSELRHPCLTGTSVLTDQEHRL